MSSPFLPVAVIVAGVLALVPRTTGAQAQDDSALSSRNGFGRSWGTSMKSLDSATIMASAGRTLSEALQAQLPGFSVLQSDGNTASGARVRLRGINSLMASTEPVVIVDGIRVDASQEATQLDLGAQMSRLDDIAREDVARVDVLPGPAAAMMYGPGASGGALVITTKRGRPGPVHWRARAESRVATVPSRFPANYDMTGIATANGQPTTDCDIVRVAAQQCTPQRLDSWNPLEQASPFKTARTGAGSAAISGGKGQTGLYLGGAGERTLGLADNDDLTRLNVRGNVLQRVGSALDLEVNTAYSRTNANFPRPWIVISGLFGSPRNDVNGGFSPTLWTIDESRQTSDHSLVGGSANWRALPWLRAALSGGRDVVEDDELQVVTEPSGTSRMIEERSGRVTRQSSTVSASMTAVHGVPMASRMTGEASVGFDKWSTRSRSIERARRGVDSIGSGAPALVVETQSLIQVSGPWIREQLAIGERGRIAAALRWEQGPAREDDSKPLRSLSGSWLVGDLGIVRDIQLRAAYGEAQSATHGTFALITMPPLPPSRKRNVNERASEIEAGVDAVVGNRLTLSATAYRASVDHLPFVRIAPPISSGAPSRMLASDATQRNEGLELLASGRIVQRENVHWNATLAASALRSKLRTLGTFPPFASGARLVPGYPAFGYWGRDYSYADANDDGIIALSEVQYGDTAVFLGPSLPTREISMRSSLTWRRSLSLGVLIDHRGGHKLFDYAGYFRCIEGHCRASQDPTAPLDEQARVIAERLFVGQTRAFIDDASFVKLREVTIRWMLPAPWGARLGGKEASISIAGRNLATWTPYTGIDPEVTARPFDDLARMEFGQIPLTRQFLVRLDVGR